MKIAFYKARYGKWLDYLIAIGTFSKYSHCEIILESGVSVSASIRDGGVRYKNIVYDPAKWDIFDLKELDQVHKNYIPYWFNTHKTNKYDFFGAIGSAFRINLADDNKKFCSYCCAMVLGVNPIVSPGRLVKILKKQGII